MSRIVVSHEYASGPDEAWYPHLRDELVLRGHQVRVPQLPEPDAPQPEAWRTTLGGEVAEPADTILVGHSIGGVNVLRQLEQHDAAQEGSYAGALLVATPAHEVGYDELAGFFDGGLDWKRIQAAATQFRVLVAVDDPVLTPEPLGHVGLLADKLGATALVTPTGQHFSRQQNRRELHEAIALVAEMLPRPT